MDMAFAMEAFDLEKAREVCEKCRWYVMERE